MFSVMSVYEGVGCGEGSVPIPLCTAKCTGTGPCHKGCPPLLGSRRNRDIGVGGLWGAGVGGEWSLYLIHSLFLVTDYKRNRQTHGFTERKKNVVSDKEEKTREH